MFSDWSARKRLVLLKRLSKEFQVSLHLKRNMLDTQHLLLILYPMKFHLILSILVLTIASSFSCLHNLQFFKFGVQSRFFLHSL